MPHTPHIEDHFTSSDMVRDIVIGMSDGLTVPFALAAGLTGAVGAAHLIVTAGFAEIVAGSIAMGLGGYLAARSDVEHYVSERRREEREVVTMKEQEREEIREIFREYNITDEQIQPILEGFERHPDKWVDFMMRFELGLDEPNPRRALTSALTIALSYIAGGVIPLASYIVFSDIQRALYASVAITSLALFIFGFIKGRFTGMNQLRSGIQTLLIGGLAAAAAYGLAKLVG